MNQTESGTNNRRASDLLTTSLFARMTTIWLGYSLKHELPPEVKKKCYHLKEAVGQYRAIVKKNVEVTGGIDFFQGMLDDEVLYNLSLLIEAEVRIAAEENSAAYLEFCNMLNGLLDSVFFSQKNRQRISFSKYKALFKLISDELKADVENHHGKFTYNREDGLCFSVTEQHSPIKMTQSA